MADLDPVRIFQRLGQDIPEPLRRHIIVTGSLAAAYEYRVKLQSFAVNTKDADLVVHPAGDVSSAEQMAERLLDIGWQRTDACKPSKNPEPREKLRAIRLMPPGSNDYFIEFLNVPAKEQSLLKDWIPVKLPDGWYGLPSFKFMGLISFDRRSSTEGLEYASPAMMAFANLLSHPRVTDDEIESGEFRGLRRCAKDLGRVIALAAWPVVIPQVNGFRFGAKGSKRAFRRVGAITADERAMDYGAMLADDEVMEQARTTTESGLLRGMGYDVAALRGVCERLLSDAIEESEADAVK